MIGILSRAILREIAAGAVLGTVLFTFVLFLQKLGRLFEQLVANNAQLNRIGALFLLILPPVLTFTIPVGVLVGVLIAMGRMSGDGEITAMRAAGVPSRRILIPVLLFATVGVALAGYASCILTPWATRETYRILNEMVAAQLTAEIRPRIFEEQFPNKVIYVDDVTPGPVVQWRRVFIADLTPPEQHEANSRSDAPRVTIAGSAIAAPDLVNNQIQLSLIGQRTFEPGKDDSEYLSTESARGQQVLAAPRRDELKASGFSELDMKPLMAEAAQSREAAIEFHRRLALPIACLVLGVLAVPLGVSTRKGGKSAAFVITVALSFLYFMGLISLVGLAKQGSLPAGLAVWTPNAVFGMLAVILIIRLEHSDRGDFGGSVKGAVGSAWNWLRGKAPTPRGAIRLPLLPQLVDTYVLSAFLYYFLLLSLSFILMTHVFTFFELLGDIIRNRTAMSRVGTYHVFLTPMLVYDAAPLAVLVAVLITFGLLAKNNEITAMKACGVSLYRLSIPILIAGIFLSGALFAFDYYVVPEANLVQDAIRNEIKGRPARTFMRPDRRWVFGLGPWIYYYKHYDSTSNVMAGVSVFELDRKNFELVRHIQAESARWEPSIGRWVFQNGWARNFKGIRASDPVDFRGQTATFEGLQEPPSHFFQEVKQEKQMNFHQLESFIGSLRQSGSDTTRLQVQYHKKFSVPLFAFIMALLSTPFAFFAGNRGAMAPVGISLGIAICYFAVSKLFEQMGNVGQLPAEIAAWSPDAVFMLAGMYFLMRVRT